MATVLDDKWDRYDSLLRVFRTQISDQTHVQIIKTVPSSSNLTLETQSQTNKQSTGLGMKVDADGDERPVKEEEFIKHLDGKQINNLIFAYFTGEDVFLKDRKLS